MAALGRSDITSEMQVKLPTNNVKFITALLLREFEEIMNESFFNLVDDTLANINLSNTNIAINAEEAITKLQGSNGQYIFYLDIEYSEAGGVAWTVHSYTSNNPTLTISHSDSAPVVQVFFTETYGFDDISIDGENNTFSSGSTATLPSGSGVIRYIFVNNKITYIADL